MLNTINRALAVKPPPVMHIVKNKL